MRPRNYTAKGLEKAVEAYFDSISREVEAKEKVDSGRRDSYGHIIWDLQVICNKRGEPVMLTEYVVPPCVGGLCAFLGIHRSTWANYCDPEQYPEFIDTTTHARERMRAWREEQLLTRKDVKGIIFDLQNNYGYREKREVELGATAAKTMAAASMPLSEREAVLREIAAAYANGSCEPEEE